MARQRLPDGQPTEPCQPGAVSGRQLEQKNNKDQNQREGPQQLETHPVVPSFLAADLASNPPAQPENGLPAYRNLSENWQSAPVEDSISGKITSKTQVKEATTSGHFDISPVTAAKEFLPSEPNNSALNETSSPSLDVQILELPRRDDHEFLPETLTEELHWDPALGLPRLQELEREQTELQQKRRQEGAAALLALEQEARNHEVARVKSSGIEIPDLGLKKQQGSSYLHVSHLHKRYGRKIAVNDISISLRQGEVVGLLGPNGAGKTTCFYMIAGFVHPTRGQVLLDEKNISRWPMYKRARQGISYLPQEASIFRSLTVEQNLLAILEYRGKTTRRARLEIAEFLLERLGVLRLRKQKASTLSGGERRRVEVARALALEPRFLLLDEPFAGIDPIAVSEIKGIIRALAQSNIGILITDHNVRDTLDITDRSYIINLGDILVSGSRAELIASKTAREVYLGAEFS